MIIGENVANIGRTNRSQTDEMKCKKDLNNNNKKTKKKQ